MGKIANIRISQIAESHGIDKYFHLPSDNLLFFFFFFIYNRNLNSTKWPYSLQKGQKKWLIRK